MKYHKQAFLHDPENGVFGDCYRTVLACLLDMERDDVPHFVNTMNYQQWEQAVQPKYDAWLSEHGVMELAIPITGDLDSVLEMQKSRGTHGYPCQLTGTSRTGCNHVVIVQDGKIIHDPSLTGSGIVGPCDDGYFWLTWIIPARHPALAAPGEEG